jgi:hypothetical protein
MPRKKLNQLRKIYFLKENFQTMSKLIKYLLGPSYILVFENEYFLEGKFPSFA